MGIRYRFADRLVHYLLRCSTQRAILVVAEAILTLLLHVEEVAAT